MGYFRFATALALLAVVSSAPAEIRRISDPCISPDGKSIAFSWQDDIWRVPATGGRAERLTVHPAQDEAPRWIGGDRIVFSSDRYGNRDLYSMKADGSEVRRLNYESSDEIPTSVSWDGRWIYGTSSAWGRQNLFALATEGGDLIRLAGHPLQPEFSPAAAPDGGIVFATNGSVGSWRRPELRGSYASDLWLACGGSPLRRFSRVTTTTANESYPAFDEKGRLFFISNESGVPNLYVAGKPGANAKRLTSLPLGTMRSLSVSEDGSLAAFQYQSRVWLWTEASGMAAPVEIDAPSDRVDNPVESLVLTQAEPGVAVSPSGRRLAFVVRGDVFVSADGGGPARPLTRTAGPEETPSFLTEDTLVYVGAGAHNKREIRIQKLGEEARVLASGADDLFQPRLSPDRAFLAYYRGLDKLEVAPIQDESLGVTVEIARGAFGDFIDGEPGFAWSPDSTTLMVMIPHTRGVDVRLVHRSGSPNLLVTRIGKSATSPMIAPDGKTLVFTGVQGLDYSETRDSVAALYKVDLVARPLEFAEDKLNEPEKKETPSKSPAPLVYETKGLDKRVRRFTDVSTRPLAIVGDQLYANVESQLSTVDLTTGVVKPVESVTGSVQSLVLDSAKSRLFGTQGGRLFRLDPKSGAKSSIAFTARMNVDLAEEERALFEEFWHALDLLFYDSNHHGRDWSKIREEHAALLPYVQNRADFYELLGEMVSRLESSHTGATPPPSGRRGSATVGGWLGVEWDPAELAKGRYVISRVYEPSPASHPQVDLHAGDQLLSVEGAKPSPERPVAALLDGRASVKTTLQIRRGNRDLDIAILPASFALRTQAAYDDWVRKNRELVEKASGGRLGYIHIRGMDTEGLDTFLRESQTELVGKDGVVLDVRYNGGGFTGQAILNTMLERPWLMRTSPDMPGMKVSENIWRGNALELPSVALINGYSFSNAEIFAEGYRRLGFGKLVGEATAGGVIGTSSRRLWDGGSFRLPGSGAYSIDGENLEGAGRKPDVEVDYDPAAWSEGRDPQIERAVKVLLADLPKR